MTFYSRNSHVCCQQFTLVLWQLRSTQSISVKACRGFLRTPHCYFIVLLRLSLMAIFKHMITYEVILCMSMNSILVLSYYYHHYSTAQVSV